MWLAGAGRQRGRVAGSVHPGVYQHQTLSSYRQALFPGGGKMVFSFWFFKPKNLESSNFWFYGFFWY